MRNSEREEAGAERKSTAFKHFGPLPKENRGAGPKIISLVLNGAVLGLLVLFSLAHEQEIKETSKAVLVYVETTPPPPPPPPIHVPPLPPPPVIMHPRITMPQVEEAPVIRPPQMKMNIPIPVIAAAPPKKVVPPPAPKMVALNVTPASVPNNYNKPSNVALGDRNALKAVDNAKPKPNTVSLGLAGMPVMNNGAGAPGARTVSLGSGAPNGSVNGTDRGRPVQGVKLGVLGGQGTTNNHSLSTVNIAGMAPAAAAPVRTIVAPTTPVTVIYTPHPAYTSAATAKGINGTVDVEVIFRANGSVQVLRVVRGLGYGLDQNALLAAASIRFKPAMQNGQPVDQHSIVHIQFQMIS